MATISEITTTQCPATWEAVFAYCAPEIDFASKIIEQYQQQGQIIFPPRHETFTAFHLTPVNQVKVVIFGQDPYPQEVVLNGTSQARARGLAFSVRPGDKIPGSLQNIYKELANSIPGFAIPNHGDLSSWARQGVLMLNTCLTVPKNGAGAHLKAVSGRGKTAVTIWGGFIDKLLACLAHYYPNCIYVMWGAKAQALKAKLPATSVFLEAPHPSGLSANKGFFGCNHFNLINQALLQQGKTPIDWCN